MGGEIVKFDLQDYLEDRFNRLENKMDKSAEVQAALDKRLSKVEDTNKTVRWVGGALVVGFFGMVFDIIANHVPGMVTGLFSKR